MQQNRYPQLTKGVLRCLFTIMVITACPAFMSHAFYSSDINSADTKIYKTVHKDGTVTYSDQPSPGSKEVAMDVNSAIIPGKSPGSFAIPSPQNQTSIKHIVKVLSPSAEATIRNNNGDINIAASLEPSLAGMFQLDINGQQYESPSGLFRLNNMDRGTYQYTVKFIDNSGKVIAFSETLRLHLHKASALIN